MKRYVFLILILIGCKQQDQEVIFNSSTLLIDEIDSTQIVRSDAAQYSREALTLLGNHRSMMNVVLRNIINDDIAILKKFESDCEKFCAFSYCRQEVLQSIEEARIKVFKQLLMKEIELNMHQINLYVQLSLLNKKFKKNHYEITLQEYYDSGYINLSEEVIQKVFELINEERIRKEKVGGRSRNDFIIDKGSMAISRIPAKSIKISITALLAAAKTYNNRALLMENNADRIENYSSKILNRKMSDYIAQYCRDELGKHINPHLWPKLEGSTYVPKYTSDYFRHVENRLKGRVGDFSDGMLAVYFQNVREIIKTNSELLTKKDNL